MIKRLLIIIFVLIIVFGGIFGFDAYKNYKQRQAMAHFKIPPVYVSTAVVQKQNWQPYLSAIGSIVAIDNVDMTSQVSGQVVDILYHSGEFVKKGQILAELDDSTQLAQLQQYKAQLILDKFNYTQYKHLYKKNAASKSSYIQSLSALKQTQALIEQTETTINKMIIKAPFSGILGINLISVGQYINPGDTIISLYSVNPVYVDFTVPQNDLDKLFVGQKVDITTDAYPNKVIIGTIRVISVNVNSVSRNVTVRAIAPNGDGFLKPGVFINVKILLPVEHNVITIPATAITYNTYGDFVYVISKKNNKLIANTRYVSTGEERNNTIIIQQDLKPGEMVVTAGQIKLMNGSEVVIKNIPINSNTQKDSNIQKN